MSFEDALREMHAGQVISYYPDFLFYVQPLNGRMGYIICRRGLYASSETGWTPNCFDLESDNYKISNDKETIEWSRDCNEAQ